MFGQIRFNLLTSLFVLYFATISQNVITTAEFVKQTNESLFDARQHRNYYLLPNLTDCGISWNETYRNRFSRSANGWPAGLGKYLMVARILVQNSTTGVEGLVCTGTLINRRYILTAAHCTIRELNHPGIFVSTIQLGVYDSSIIIQCKPNRAECAMPVSRGVEEITIHEDFNLNLDNDIALIRVDEDILFDDFVKPACLPYSESLLENWKDQRIAAVGWGEINPYSDTSRQLPTKLTEITVSLISPDLCNTFGSRLFGTLSANKLCMIGANEEDTCRGDSGSPLIRNIDVQFPNGENLRRQFQIGIVSSGTSPLDCGRQGVPSVAINVVRYMPWILNNLRP